MGLYILWTFISVGFTSLLSLIGIIFLSISPKTLNMFLLELVSLSVGALIGDCFIHIFPDVFDKLGDQKELIAALILGGYFMGFIFEKLIGGDGHQHDNHELTSSTNHDHHDATTPLLVDHEVYPDLDVPHASMRQINAIKQGKAPKKFIWIVLIGDAIHNFTDGVIIAASYVGSTKLGLATTLAVVLHEVPHEIGNFAVFIHGGLSMKRALLLNFVGAFTSVLGAIATLIVAKVFTRIIYYVLPFAAGNFIYVASADLIPELHRDDRKRSLLTQLLGIAIGIGAMITILIVENKLDLD